MENNVLEALMRTLPMMQEIFGLDVQICLCDREKTIGVWYAKSFRLDIRVGEYFDPSQPAHQEMLAAMKTGKQTVNILPKFVYGVPVRGIITPIADGDEIVGVLSCAVSLEKQAEIEAAANILSNNIHITNDNANEIAAGAAQLASQMGVVSQISGKIHVLAEQMQESVGIIRNNSTRSNMIALNASIEAARVGEAGRGFAVVAQEMGKLAKSSGNATGEISAKLDTTFTELNGILEQIGEVSNVAGIQAKNVEEIAASLEEIQKNAEMLTAAANIV
ncbi:MAG: methyl-accepting chemotaxis protein [bacterium]|nr:methyl-accepting chemotaxis protein [bacterium]